MKKFLQLEAATDSLNSIVRIFRNSGKWNRDWETDMGTGPREEFTAIKGSRGQQVHQFEFVVYFRYLMP